jgi:hypothetical protein
VFYALVMQGKVLGFRDNVDEQSLALAERTALVAWAGEPIDIYEVEGHMPHDAGVAMARLELWLTSNPSAEPVCTVRAEEDAEDSGRPSYDSLETTGCFQRSSGEPGSSGFFSSVG